jgi:hypothetical protein
MKLQFAVITFFVLGCSAAFGQGSATLGFASAGDLTLDCDYEQFSWGGADNIYAQGIDNVTDCIGAYNNGTMEGFKLSLPVTADSPVRGLTYAFADNILDAQYGTYTGEQWLLVTQTKPSRFLKQ